eukprot:CAMPEP_0175056102 /NCGR_PEP_ID=MMETSP0052_2-20121109/10473_1 /TAXON_ID=51329 ORGANISM="Polytomella parva, Strain SAG 63-3" /NCGR_SAMPLE_ID=MMETSP0052_2 /ASSEMBLY_ACC=CAM_ASM_000194 /LENGTH=176 /DNA_ID=CAMNT_0016321069 /DNA_START=275 /DNA_END=805 /DNA_ORIENTATION=+
MIMRVAAVIAVTVAIIIITTLIIAVINKKIVTITISTTIPMGIRVKSDTRIVHARMNTPRWYALAAGPLHDHYSRRRREGLVAEYCRENWETITNIVVDTSHDATEALAAIIMIARQRRIKAIITAGMTHSSGHIQIIGGCVHQSGYIDVVGTAEAGAEESIQIIAAVVVKMVARE